MLALPPGESLVSTCPKAGSAALLPVLPGSNASKEEPGRRFTFPACSHLRINAPHFFQIVLRRFSVVCIGKRRSRDPQIGPLAAS